MGTSTRLDLMHMISMAIQSALLSSAHRSLLHERGLTVGIVVPIDGFLMKDRYDFHQQLNNDFDPQS